MAKKKQKPAEEPAPDPGPPSLSSTLPMPDTITAADLATLDAAYPRLTALLARRAAADQAAKAASAKPRAAGPAERRGAARLVELDRARHLTIPAQIAERRRQWRAKGGGGGGGKEGEEGGWLTLDEAKELMEWKLTRGKSRPTLRALIARNTAADVRIETARGLALLHARPHAPAAALTPLCALTGVGPATASLLLSAARPDAAPFFADELFAWAARAGGASAKLSPAKGIRYDQREYRFLSEVVARVRERLAQAGEAGESRQVGAGEVERGAFVLETVQREGQGLWAEIWAVEMGDGAEEGGKWRVEETGEDFEALEQEAAASRKRKLELDEMDPKKQAKKAKKAKRQHWKETRS